MPRKGKPIIVTAHDRELKRLIEARLDTARSLPKVPGIPPPSQVISPKEEKLPRVYTFNWKGDKEEPIFVPRLATEKEYPYGPDRAFVNAVAKGESDIRLDRRILDKDPNRFYELMLEGIKRWHTYSKER